MVGDGHHPTLESVSVRPARVELSLKRGRIDVGWPGLAGLSDIRALVRLTDGRSFEGGLWRRSGHSYSATCGPLRLVLHPHISGGRLRLRVTAVGLSPALVAEIGLICDLSIRGSNPQWVVYSGYHSWDAAGVAPAVDRHGAPGQVRSWWTCGLARDDGCGIAATALAAHRATTRFDVRGGQLTVTTSEPAGLQRLPLLWKVRPGASWRADDVVFAAGEDVQSLLSRIVRLVRSRPRDDRVPKGWLSWYHHGPWVSRDDVLANSEVLAQAAFKSLGYSIVLVDDGWQESYGEWRENSKFPGGLAALAAELDRRGQVLGVWTAPFLVLSTSELARTAPDDWFVMDPTTGERAIDPVHFVYGPMNVLDARRSAVRRHLADVFRQLHAAGVRYFKIDFLYAAGYAGTAAVRAGVRAIREAIGDSYLLASGAPLLPVAGLVDGCRIGRDTATPLFDFEKGVPRPTLMDDEVAEVARNQAARYFLDAWFQTDPDVALVGGSLTLEQARTCVTVCALSGGPFFASDDLTVLDGDRLALLSNAAVVELAHRPGAKPEWRPSSRDRASEVWRRADVVALFNWEAEEREVRFDLPGRCRLHDLWSDADLGWHQGAASLAVPPAGVRLVRVAAG